MPEKIVLPSQEELMNGHSHFMEQLGWIDEDISGNILDVTLTYQRPKFTMSYRGVKMAPLGGVQLLSGQAGSGKTMAFTQFMVAVLKGEYGELRYELVDDVPRPKSSI